MVDTELAALMSRSPHVVPVDPSLASFFVQEGYIEGYRAVAMLTLTAYNARCVAIR